MSPPPLRVSYPSPCLLPLPVSPTPPRVSAPSPCLLPCPCLLPLPVSPPPPRVSSPSPCLRPLSVSPPPPHVSAPSPCLLALPVSPPPPRVSALSPCLRPLPMSPPPHRVSSPSPCLLPLPVSPPPPRVSSFSPCLLPLPVSPPSPRVSSPSPCLLPLPVSPPPPRVSAPSPCLRPLPMSPPPHRVSSPSPCLLPLPVSPPPPRVSSLSPCLLPLPVSPPRVSAPSPCLIPLPVSPPSPRVSSPSPCLLPLPVSLPSPRVSAPSGLHSFFSFLLLAYFLSCCIYTGPLQRALRKRGPMHTALKLLTAALALQGGSALWKYIHLCRFSTDGSGFPLMGHLADFWDMLSQGAVLFLLLSLCGGWTLTRVRKAQSRPLQWEWSPASAAFSVGGVIAQGVLLLWEQLSEAEPEHHGSHAQQSWASVLLVVLRVGLAVLLASVLFWIISTERSALKRDFYLSFSRACFLWFLCQPVLVFLSGVFNRHQRQKVVTVGVVLCRSISMVILYQLFLSRSLYWEVSSLSSVSLPLTMSTASSRGRQ
ncbi:integral membrane protein GPR180 isoform X2 [Oryzias latipes]